MERSHALYFDSLTDLVVQYCHHTISSQFTAPQDHYAEFASELSCKLLLDDEVALRFNISILMTTGPTGVRGAKREPPLARFAAVAVIGRVGWGAQTGVACDCVIVASCRQETKPILKPMRVSGIQVPVEVGYDVM